MTTSNSYSFNPSLGELTLHAYNMIGVRPTAITQEHMFTARMATNLLLSNWSNRGVNLWAVDLVTTPLIEGQTTYDVSPDTVMVLDAYISVVQDEESSIDRIILPVSRTEYASYPNKTQQGFPTVYWFDRLNQNTTPSAANTAQIYLWPVPDNSTNELRYYRVKRLQDSSLGGGQTLDIPYLWMDCFAYGLAHRLSEIWAPQLSQLFEARADKSYQIAAEQNTEYAQVYVSPQIQGYFR